MCLAVSFTIAVQPIKVHHSLTVGHYCKNAIIGPKLLTLLFFWYHTYGFLSCLRWVAIFDCASTDFQHYIPPFTLKLLIYDILL